MSIAMPGIILNYIYNNKYADFGALSHNSQSDEKVILKPLD